MSFGVLWRNGFLFMFYTSTFRREVLRLVRYVGRIMRMIGGGLARRGRDVDDVPVPSVGRSVGRSVTV